jgi:ribosomal RNA-processing protein 9
VFSSLYVWSTSKKKPVCVVKDAHGMNDEGTAARWLVSVAALPYSDLIASGSSDGKLKLWKVGENYKTLSLIDEFQLVSFWYFQLLFAL